MAAWSPSGASINQEAIILNKAFFDALFGVDQSFRLGDAINRSLFYYDSLNRGFEHMKLIYNLLGDPAVNLR